MVLSSIYLTGSSGVLSGLAAAGNQSNQGNSKVIHVLHNSEYPASVFSILDTGTKQISLTADSLFDLLIIKMTPAYTSKKQTRVNSKYSFNGYLNVMLNCKVIMSACNEKKSHFLTD